MTTDTAEAGIIVSTNTMVIDCGCVGTPFASDSLSDSFRTVTLGFAADGMTRTISANNYQFFDGVKGFGIAQNSSGSVQLIFRFLNASLSDPYTPARFMRLLPTGATFNSGAQKGVGSAWGYWPGFAIAHQRAHVTYSTTGAPSNTHVFTHTKDVGSTFPSPIDPTNKYALFSFTDSAGAPNQTYYGWINIGIEIGANGPVVTVRSWAYDDSGAMLYAGEGDPIPEPSTLAMTGIAALALGARGIRRWRAARNQS